MTGEYGLLAIGGGPAGLSAVRSFREAGGGGAVGLVTDERRIPYDRPPLSKELLRGETGEHEIALEDETWFAEHEVGLIGGLAVEIDVAERAVTLSGGRRLRYAHCVLATGAEPTRPDVPGCDDPGVRVLRSLDDLRDLRRRLDNKLRVVVIGSGFIGCEIAASLRMLGHAVVLTSDEPAPNQRRLGPQGAGEIAGWLQQLGVELVLGAELTGIDRSGTRLEARLGDRGLAGELIVMATGVRPRSELAAGAGLELDAGAIPVDAAMRTDAPGLLAAGDVCAAENRAAGRRLRVEHWGDALRHGAIAGRAAAGADDVWDDVPGFWSTIGGRTLKYAAWGDGYDELRFARGDDGAFAVDYGRDGQLVAVLSHNRDDAYERGRDLIAGGARWN